MTNTWFHRNDSSEMQKHTWYETCVCVWICYLQSHDQQSNQTVIWSWFQLFKSCSTDVVSILRGNVTPQRKHSVISRSCLIKGEENRGWEPADLMSCTANIKSMWLPQAEHCWNKKISLLNVSSCYRMYKYTEMWPRAPHTAQASCDGGFHSQFSRD